MKAMAWTAYGPPEVLKLEEMEKPVPKDNEIMVRVRAATVTAGDCEMRSLKLPMLIGLPMRIYVGILTPKRIRVLGQELAGDVEATGRDVRGFKAGDRIFGVTGFRFGAYAEYACLPEDGVLAKIPGNLSYAEAAGVPVGGMEALHFLRLANLRAGQKILINGAGGSIGTLGIQLARHFGAQVTAVDSGEKLDMLRALGAEHTIDYTKENFTTRGDRYDAIFDVVGKSPFAGSLRALNENGSYLIANPGLTTGIRKMLAPGKGNRSIYAVPAAQKTEDLLYLKGLIEAGVIRPVIDRWYPLEQAVEAHHYVESGRKKGNVVITVSD